MSGADPPTAQWDPTPILDERSLRGKPYRFSLVILNQPIHNIPLFLDLWRRVRIAADGGANRVHAIRAHLPPTGPKLDFIVGDLDSLRSETREWFLHQPGLGSAGQQHIVEVQDQDSTDFAKAVKHARELSRKRAWGRPSAGGSNDPAEDIICYSGLGGRVDQAMSQLHHLYMFQRRRRRRPSDATGNEAGTRERPEDGDSCASGRMYLTNGESLTFVLLAGRHAIRIRDKLDHPPVPAAPNSEHETKGASTTTASDARKPTVFGKHVGIIPLAGPSLLTTRGLEWDVRDWETEFGGRMSTSNHTTPGSDVVEVETSRDVLFTIDIPVLV
ncbi:hypothetical protein DL766_002752 [Monosporascus sp. MC13-8B]|uniref:Thiamine pyrophosphokinase n=1 Tax=Monosporascus cannonballus TaxID=155416 RepID=A0ABY0HN97_9PEZI|nr:hypothetical protein DL763_010699 [Monosporascus cannonballus]RYO94867.1 hypothetical protein DL762_000301 [Monosporascus cannonballus]RYP34911.1 hypothetical protein DL766_002752 [Monosporascus sp. MC13-8B]